MVVGGYGIFRFVRRIFGLSSTMSALVGPVRTGTAYQYKIAFVFRTGKNVCSGTLQYWQSVLVSVNNISNFNALKYQIHGLR